jgi:hypothetical protein
MRSPIVLAALVAAGALAVAPSASAHPQFWPVFVEQGADADILLTAPNERKAPMTAIELVPPATVEIVAAGSKGAWQGTLDDGVATWSGGRLAKGAWGQFPVRLLAKGEPGTAQFGVTQRFADGRAARWRAVLAVNPSLGDPAGTGGGHGVVLGAVAVAGVVGASLLGLWRLRRRPP